jgi:hypothetical protein
MHDTPATSQQRLRAGPGAVPCSCYSPTTHPAHSALPAPGQPCPTHSALSSPGVMVQLAQVCNALVHHTRGDAVAWHAVGWVWVRAQVRVGRGWVGGEGGAGTTDEAAGGVSSR